MSKPKTAPEAVLVGQVAMLVGFALIIAPLFVQDLTNQVVWVGIAVALLGLTLARSIFRSKMLFLAAFGSAVILGGAVLKNQGIALIGAASALPGAFLYARRNPRKITK